MTVAEFAGKKNGASVEDAPLDSGRIEEIRARLRTHQDTTSVNGTEIGRKTGYASQSVNLFLNGKYPGNPMAIARAIESYLDMYEAQQSIGKGTEFVPTSISRKIERAIFIAEATQRIAVIAMQSGLGKTRTLQEYRFKHAAKARSVFVSCSPDLNTKWSLINELIYATTKDESRRRSPSHARRELVQLISGTNRTLFVDEAQYLNEECLEVLRTVSDQAGVALILSGNESIYERGAGKIGGAAAHAQFTSRVVARVHLGTEDITKGDVKAIAVQMIPESTLVDTFDVLVAETRNTGLSGTSAGGFRRLITILTLAQMLAAKKGVKRAHVLRAIADLNQMSGEDGGDL